MSGCARPSKTLPLRRWICHIRTRTRTRIHLRELPRVSPVSRSRARGISGAGALPDQHLRRMGLVSRYLPHSIIEPNIKGLARLELPSLVRLHALTLLCLLYRSTLSHHHQTGKLSNGTRTNCDPWSGKGIAETCTIWDEMRLCETCKCKGFCCQVLGSRVPCGLHGHRGD
ncbi:hypothetical protein SODALDRAFT_7503 [Sodiomyces alkalinus F11]|uniref:Uncharacterized protein n=1 Tax=Sodiomyces alkalinus (strain CBS 110278 / VKM F-3762 / F11) TaxID=1314773 RepID=A0A3N2Q652_SODAK|nr:hypothetical protein SODALDRAFT_7503 [Sodiomyces alkalinus F11]ROT42105.1 hypothetical protein SODALDRAFT_7503 [Sodiomyces alkalinus F11]